MEQAQTHAQRDSGKKAGRKAAAACGGTPGTAVSASSRGAREQVLPKPPGGAHTLLSDSGLLNSERIQVLVMYFVKFPWLPWALKTINHLTFWFLFANISGELIDLFIQWICVKHLPQKVLFWFFYFSFCVEFHSVVSFVGTYTSPHVHYFFFFLFFAVGYIEEEHTGSGNHFSLSFLSLQFQKHHE